MHTKQKRTQKQSYKMHPLIPETYTISLTTSTNFDALLVRSFIKPDLFDHNVPFDNTTPIYLINLPWKLGLGLGLDLKLHYVSIFHGE